MRPLTGIGLIGGGRWARVIATVLDTVLSGRVPVTLCSPNNPDGWRNWPDQPGWVRVADLESVLDDPHVSHVIIARQARDHASTTLATLAAEKAVLVEKPFCLTQAECAQVLEAAKGRLCLTGLVFLHAANLARFAAACREAGAASRIEVVWSDPAREIRHAERKAYDQSLNVVQDVFPHIWSLVRPFCPAGPLQLAWASSERGGQVVRLGLSGSGISVDAQLRRNHCQRERTLKVEGRDLCAQMDFTSEPGHAVVNGQTLDIKTGFSSPLAAQLRAFLECPINSLSDVAVAAEAIGLSLAALALIRPAQALSIRKALLADAEGTAQDDACYALRELRTGGPEGDGKLIGTAELTRWLGVSGPGVEQRINVLLGGTPDVRSAAPSNTSLHDQ